MTKGVRPKGALAPEMMKMFLAEYVAERAPRSRYASAFERSEGWVSEYLAANPGALEAAAAKLSSTYEMEELLAVLPGFWAFMKAKDPGLHERPTGMY